uniref:Protein kinase domain-containing protein n=1 Tax=Meloidogyne floridensis TaxID=298350 RepID=A0A915NVN2_9BILA
MHTASISSEASVQSFQGATQEFLVVADIASGGYGAVYKVRGSKGGVFALKLEKRAPKRDHYKLQMEVRVLQAAAKAKPEERQHLPTLIDHSEPHTLTLPTIIKFKGTVRFAPVTMHKMEELGRKDDCESWIYMVVDMVNENRLPWHMVTDVDEVERMKRKAIAEPKRIFPKAEETELREVVTYLNGLHYVDKIDYKWIREMVRRVAKRRNCSLLGQFDWQINP